MKDSEKIKINLDAIIEQIITHFSEPCTTYSQNSLCYLEENQTLLQLAGDLKTAYEFALRVEAGEEAYDVL